MKKELKKIALEVLEHPRNRCLLFYVKKALNISGYSKYKIDEFEHFEFSVENITFVISWDNISALNNTNNEYVDIHCIDNCFKVFFGGIKVEG